MYKIIVFVICLFSEINLSLMEDPMCPQIFQCNEVPSSKICYSEAAEMGIRTSTVKGCQYGETCILNENKKGTCTSFPLHLPPGLYCNNNSECISVNIIIV